MPDDIKRRDARRLAALEISAMRFLGVLPAEIFEGARIAATGTPIHDLNGEVLFYRLSLSKKGAPGAYADAAANAALGAPLLAVSHGHAWDERAILRAAKTAARKALRGRRYDRMRFVAYSFPKVAVQFLAQGKELLMLEWGTWKTVPPARKRRRKALEPGNFERWSLLDELSPARKRAGARKYARRAEAWGERRFARLAPSIISAGILQRLIKVIRLVDTRELHYSSRQTDHHTCYELRGQETNVWCVAASVQMMLDFYRYGYTQDRIAQALGLGTKANPNGLPYSRVQDVVTELEALTSNALDATMIVNPTFATFRNEIRQNRPLISFIPGHSRTVAGYIRWLIAPLGQIPFRGLLVYDPWPPNAGVITRWENFDTQTYQYAYTASVTLV